MIQAVNKNTLVKFLILVSAFGAVYSHTISKLVKDWSIDPNFSHGFLIPVVALYMIWHNKESLQQIPARPVNSGILIIILGMLAHIAGNLGAELFVQRVSMLITLFGAVLFLHGFRMCKALLVPLFYLLLMIPIPSIIWNKIAFPLQLFAAARASEMIQLIGIPVFREGNILHLANTSLEVVDACSGIRSLTSLLALSGAFAYISPLKAVNKWILFLSAIPIAVAVNVFRLTVTACAAVWIGPETAHGFLHDMSGLIVFGAALVLLYLVFAGISKIEKTGSGENPKQS
ncbi:MAG: exosortase/archaeosortase family protein [Thermodesulfobacteriota bacterium]